MKPLTCEMCGSNNLIKQEGVFVCQSCGTKYSVEEARKMMIEGTVDVSGSTVLVDNTEEIKNLYTLARRAKEADNYENAAKYYEMILMKDSSSWEANFFAVYYQSIQCKVGQIGPAATDVSNCIESTFRLIADNVTEVEERKNAIEEIRVRSLFLSDMLKSSAEKHYRVQEVGYDEWERHYTPASTIRGEFYIDFVRVFENDEELMELYGIEMLKPVRKSYTPVTTFLKQYEDKKKQEQLERIKEYWDAHPEEYKALNEKKSQAESLKQDLNAEMSTIPELLEANDLQSQINVLNNKYKSLGLFKKKEKMELSMEIAALNSKLEPILAVIEQKRVIIQSKIDEQDKIISEVMYTLNNKYC